MKILTAPTEDFIRKAKTNLTADATAGSSVVLSVPNSNGFAINDYVVVGLEGSEYAELCQVSAVATTTITITTLALSHKSGEPIVKYRYNKRKFYGCATLSGTYIELSSYGSPATIAVGDPLGTSIEYTGSEGYVYFKSTYYNSTEVVETSTADADAVLADESVRYCSIFSIKKQAGMQNNPYLSDGIVETYRKRAENEVNSYLYSTYVLPLENSSGTPEIPFIIENCTVLLAAGYMDYQEFGSEGEGVKWLGEARAVLKALQRGDQRLIGVDGEQFVEKTLTSGVQSYPDQVDDENGPDRKFTMRQRF